MLGIDAQLVNALAHNEPNVRRAACVALGTLGIASAGPELAKLIRDKHWQIQEAAISALMKLNARGAADILSKLLLKDAAPPAGTTMEAALRKAVMDAITGKAEPPPAKDATKPAALGAPAGKDKKQPEHPRVKKAAAMALARFMPNLIAPLVAMLDAPNPQVKQAALAGLGALEWAEAVDKIIEVLGDTDQDVRKIAAQALGKIKDPRATQPLLALLQDSKSIVRQEAVIALNNIKPPEALEPLANVALKDESIDVRRVAAIALGNTRRPEAVAPLLDALKDHAWKVTEAAIQSIGNVKVPGTAQHILPFIVSENQDLQAAASVVYVRLAGIEDEADQQ